MLSPTVRVTRGAALDKARSSAVQWRGVKYHLDLGQLLAVLFVGQIVRLTGRFSGQCPAAGGPGAVVVGPMHDGEAHTAFKIALGK